MSVVEVSVVHGRDAAKLARSVPPAIAEISQAPGAGPASAWHCIERPGEAALFIDWESVEAHERFREGPGLQRATAHLAGTVQRSEFAHYLPIASHGQDMRTDSVIEIAVLQAKDGLGAQLAAGANDALSVIVSGDGCTGASAWSCVERDDEVLFAVDWDSVEGHERFRSTDAFAEYRSHIADYLAGTPRYAHYRRLY